jgi:hypothetical protein
MPLPASSTVRHYGSVIEGTYLNQGQRLNGRTADDIPPWSGGFRKAPTLYTNLHMNTTGYSLQPIEWPPDQIRA